MPQMDDLQEESFLPYDVLIGMQKISVISPIDFQKIH
jgi:hypothetical protein